MYPTVVEFQGTQLPVRQLLYNEATEGFTVHFGSSPDRSHARPVTDIFLNTADNFPTDSIVVTYDPVTQETVNVPKLSEHICGGLNDAGECISSDSDDEISSDASGSEDTVYEKRMLNKRVLKKVKIIGEKLTYFSENTKKQTDSLIRSNIRQRAWKNHIFRLLNRVIVDINPE